MTLITIINVATPSIIPKKENAEITETKPVCFRERKYLKAKVRSILENIKDSYYTSLNMVEKIPVDWSKIGLKTWEEIALQQQ